MRLVVTGGGTGGHVYPALEVARLARDQGHEVLFLGSLRGQEKAVCAREGFLFHGFPSEPLYSMKTPRGWKAAFHIAQARLQAITALKAAKPRAVFSTGGYSAGPVVSAARALRIPYVLHEANSAPGRSNLLFAKQAFAVCIVFPGAATHFGGLRVERTGMPIRRELREAAAQRAPHGLRVLATGGSQGSAFLNGALPGAAAALAREDVSWLHVSGKAHFDAVSKAAAGLKNYEVKPFLEGPEMGKAYGEACAIVCRSGGSLAEVALFGIPSVLVPLPTAAADHQTANAQEFVEMGAAVLHPQVSSTPERLASDLLHWLSNPDARADASDALRSFDVPEATDRILRLVLEAAR